MRKLLLASLTFIVILGAVVGYHFTDSSIQSRSKDLALNADSCLFFSSSSELAKRYQIYCSSKNILSVIKGSTYGLSGTPIITDKTLKGLGDIVVFELFTMKDDRSFISVKLYQYGNLFELKNVDLDDTPGYSIAINRAAAGNLHR